MTLHPNWRAILTRAWSVRLMLAAGILSGLEVTLQVVVGLGYATIGLAVLSGLVTAAALVARIVAQRDVPE
jgi:hypothetical protein